MADSSSRDIIAKKKIGVCRVEPLSNMAQEERNQIQEEPNSISQEEFAKDFNKGLEEIFLFDLLIK